MRLPLLLVALATAVSLTALPASTAGAQTAEVVGETSIEDLLELSATGLSDDILIAMFQSTGTVFYLSVDDLIVLRQRGLSERVLLAMLATRFAPPQVELVREPFPGDAAPPHEPAPPVVNVTQEVHQTVEQVVEAPRRTSYVYVPVAVPVRGARRVEREPDPVYWGFGGQRRPDSWEPTPRTTRPSGTGRTSGGDVSASRSGRASTSSSSSTSSRSSGSRTGAASRAAPTKARATENKKRGGGSVPAS